MSNTVPAISVPTPIMSLVYGFAIQMVVTSTFIRFICTSKEQLLLVLQEMSSCEASLDIQTTGNNQYTLVFTRTWN